MEIELGIANISKSLITIKLHDKYAKISNLDEKEEIQKFTKINDTIELNTNNIDKNDYERVLEKFKSMDLNIKAHEQLHSSLATTKGSISYSYHLGPDGKMYVNGGHVRLDTSIPNDPKEASVKLDKIKKAASAPDGLSAADASIAREANIMKIRLSIEETKPTS